MIFLQNPYDDSVLSALWGTVFKLFIKMFMTGSPVNTYFYCVFMDSGLSNLYLAFI